MRPFPKLNSQLTMMKVKAAILFIFVAVASAQTKSPSAWRRVPTPDYPSAIILETKSIKPIINPFVEGGKEYLSLSIFCDVHPSVVHLQGHFRLANDMFGTVDIDDQGLLVDWQVGKDRDYMEASKADVESLPYRLRHGKELMIGFQTEGGPRQYATFSLVGLDALMRQNGCN